MERDAAPGPLGASFVNDYDVEATLVFDDEYEDVLQLELEEKRELLQHSLAVWLLWEGRLAGEVYGLSPKDMFEWCGERIEDTEPSDGESVYVFSTTILKPYRGRGLAKILKAYFQGSVAARGYKAILGHATSPAMVRINAAFNATFGAVHEHWYGTERVARFYRIAL